MSKLEELIEKLCPNGVEFKNLQYLCGTITTGKLNANAMEDNGLYPFFTCDSNPFKINTYAFDEEAILISGNGSQVGHINYYKGKFNAYQRTYVIYDFKEINVKFLLHYLNGYLKEYILRNCKKGSVPYITLPMLQKFSVPVPPLEVQCEIVHILDDFTLLSAELSAELKARQKQYQFYLNNLLDIEKLKPQKIMYVKDLFEIKNGLNKEKGAFGKGTPIVNFTDVYKNRYLTKNMLKGKVTLNEREIKRYAVEKGDVFFTRTSETKEDIGMSSTVIEDIEKCTFSGFVLRARPTTDLLIPKFCAYYFSTNKVRDTIIRYASFTTRATTSGPKLAKIPVPIISIKEQEKIVNILDRFDKLCNDISEGLPAEIEARQKQYEYYRDKLLTFKELKVNE